MSRDYKPAAPKERSNSKGSPFFTGLLVGLLLGVAAAVGVAMLIKGGGSPFTSKVTQAEKIEPMVEPVTGKPDTSALPKAENPDTSGKPRFDFYTILPGSESQVTEKEIKQNEQNADAAKVKDSYFLQVGAFKTEQEADNVKAKLALLGMESVVQTVTIPEKGVWHRVRVGPFAELNQITKIKSELVQNGFTADLIKIHSNVPNQ